MDNNNFIWSRGKFIPQYHSESNNVVYNKDINDTLQGKCSYEFSGMGKHKQACLAPAYLFVGALACVQPP